MGGKGHFTSKSNMPCDPTHKWKPALKIITAPSRYEK